MPDQPSAQSKCQCGTLLDLTGWCPTCMEVTRVVTSRDDFLRKLDALIEQAEVHPFLGRRKALGALRQVRRQRSLA